MIFHFLTKLFSNSFVMKKIIFSLALLLSTFNVFGQTNADKLTENLEQLQRKSKFPGFAVAVVDKNGTVYKSGFGLASIEKRIPYTTRTIQPIGSVSKTFIGVALMKAIENGDLSLDTKIQDALPFKIFNPYFPSEAITLRHLATHTSGIVDREEIYEKTYLKEEKTNNTPLKDFLTDYLNEKGKYFDKRNFADAKPGTSFNYTNIGATLAAYAIEAKTNTSFADFTNKFIFKLLAMNDTSWFYEESKAENYAVLYDPQRKPYPVYSSITYPDGSLRTSVEDLSKYLAEIIKGNTGKGKILSKESFQILLGKQFALDKLPNDLNPKEPNQGIFFVHRANGQIGHTGSDLGVSAFLFFNPKTGVGKIFVANTDVSEDRTLAAQFAEIWKIVGENEEKLIVRK